MEKRRKKSLLALMLEVDAFRSFVVKVSMFIIFGLGMNLIDNEAVCYAIILFGVIAFVIKIVMEGSKH